MANAVIYARYSDRSQTEDSIDGQLKECYAYAKAKGYNVIEEYIDRALTGTSDNRKRFQRMIADSYKKHFQYVLVYQFDQLYIISIGERNPVIARKKDWLSIKRLDWFFYVFYDIMFKVVILAHIRLSTYRVNYIGLIN